MMNRKTALAGGLNSREGQVDLRRFKCEEEQARGSFITTSVIGTIRYIMMQ